MELTWTPEGWEVTNAFGMYLGDIYPAEIEGFDAVTESGKTKNFPTLQAAREFFRQEKDLN